MRTCSPWQTTPRPASRKGRRLGDRTPTQLTEINSEHAHARTLEREQLMTQHCLTRLLFLPLSSLPPPVSLFFFGILKNKKTNKKNSEWRTGVAVVVFSLFLFPSTGHARTQICGDLCFRKRKGSCRRECGSGGPSCPEGRQHENLWTCSGHWRGTLCVPSPCWDYGPGLAPLGYLRCNYRGYHHCTTPTGSRCHDRSLRIHDDKDPHFCAGLCCVLKPDSVSSTNFLSPSIAAVMVCLTDSSSPLPLLIITTK